MGISSRTLLAVGSSSRTLLAVGSSSRALLAAGSSSRTLLAAGSSSRTLLAVGSSFSTRPAWPHDVDACNIVEPFKPIASAHAQTYTRNKHSPFVNVMNFKRNAFDVAAIMTTSRSKQRAS